MLFWLGTHLPSWLRKTAVPLFLSRRRLSRLRKLPRARGPWALDSGGFSELSMYGEWRTNPEQYVKEVRWWSSRIGQMRWAAIQDWMCEPFILAKTNRTVEYHQRRTIQSYLYLLSLAPEISWTPVIQGFTYSEYRQHVRMYKADGVDLSSLPLVGLGSVCRRQGTYMVEKLVRDLTALGINLHGFGFKINGLRKVARYLTSADSMAWSFTARRSRVRLEGCRHQNCANCIKYAAKWHRELLKIPHVTTSGA